MQFVGAELAPPSRDSYQFNGSRATSAASSDKSSWAANGPTATACCTQARTQDVAHRRDILSPADTGRESRSAAGAARREKSGPRKKRDPSRSRWRRKNNRAPTLQAAQANYADRNQA